MSDSVPNYAKVASTLAVKKVQFSTDFGEGRHWQIVCESHQEITRDTITKLLKAHEGYIAVRNGCLTISGTG